MVEEEREVAVAASPSCCVEVFHEGGDLLDDRADGREGWLADNQLDRDGNHVAAHHFGDSGHGGRDGYHLFCWGEAVVAIKNDIVDVKKELTTNTRHGVVHGLRLPFIG